MFYLLVELGRRDQTSLVSLIIVLNTYIVLLLHNGLSQTFHNLVLVCPHLLSLPIFFFLQSAQDISLSFSNDQRQSNLMFSEHQ